MTQATTPAPTAASVTAPAIAVVDLGAQGLRGVRAARPRRPAGRTRGARWPTRPSTSWSPASSSRARAPWSTRCSGPTSARSTTTSPPRCPPTSGTAPSARPHLVYDGDPPRREPVAARGRAARTSSRAAAAACSGEPAGRRRRDPAPAQDARRRPGPGRHPGRRRPRLGARGRQPRRDLDGRRGAVRHRRLPGAHPQRARLPAAGPRPVPHRGVRPHQDRLLPGLAADPGPRRGPPAARSAACRCMPVSSPLRARAVAAERHGAQHRVRLPGPGRASCRAGRRRGGATGWPAEAARRGASRSATRSTAQFEAERAALADPAAAQQVIDELERRQGSGSRRCGPRRRSGARRSTTASPTSTPTSTTTCAARIRRGAPGGRRRDRGGRPGRHLAADGGVAAVADLVRAARELHLAAPPGRRAERAGRRALPRGVGRGVPASSAVYNPTPLSPSSRSSTRSSWTKMTAGKQAMVALKSAYGGALMFTMLGAHGGHRARPDRRGHRPGDGPQGAAGREEAPARASGGPRPRTPCAGTATR